MNTLECAQLKVLDNAFQKWYNEDYYLPKDPQQKFAIFTYNPDRSAVNFHIGYYENQVMPFFNDCDKELVISAIHDAHVKHGGKVAAVVFLSIKYDNMEKCRFMSVRVLVK